MVRTIDIIYEIVKEITEILPKSNHEIGEYSGNGNTFCYYVSYNKEYRKTKYVKETLTDIEIIYHDETDYIGNGSLENNLIIQEDLKQFLNKFIIKINDRALSFEYDIENNDGVLQIILSFRYMDDLIDLEYEKEQSRSKMQNIDFESERVIDK